MKVNNYYKASSLDEAYEVLMTNPKNIIIGGGAWLKLTNKEVDTIVDISKINLHHIVINDDRVEIGAMTSLKDIEDNSDIKCLYDGILSEAISHVVGVSIRNIATIGGSIIGKYSFSDILTPLLVMNTSLVFYKQGEIKLYDYLNTKKPERDILVKIVIKKEHGDGYFHKMQKTALDFAVVNCAITKSDSIKIAIGSRPSICSLSEKAMKYINSQVEISSQEIEETAMIAVNEMKFGTNSRATKEYRKQIAEVYIKRGLTEVMANEN